MYELLYAQGIQSPHEPEFRAYNILLHVAEFGGYDPKQSLFGFVKDIKAIRPEILVWGGDGGYCSGVLWGGVEGLRPEILVLGGVGG